MGALALGLVVLYEVAVQVTRRHDRRIARRRAGSELPDGNPHPLETAVPV